MKKRARFYVVTILIIVITTIILKGEIVENMRHPENKYINLQITKIEVEDLTDGNLKIMSKYGTFADIEIPADVAADILQNPLNYKTITYYYNIENGSKDLPIFDVRFNPLFNEKAEPLVVCYNDFGGFIVDKALTVSENSSNHTTQFILIKSDGMTDGEIIECMKTGRVEMNYFTDRRGLYQLLWEVDYEKGEGKRHYQVFDYLVEN